MLEIGIPVFHARDTLCDALDSLVVQTKKNFIVCLSIDCDGEDYSDIIDRYWSRGLRIRVINGQTNGGPGVARQRVIDTTKCDYIMFLDSDDMLMPRAVEILYSNAKIRGYDVMKSSFIREVENDEDRLMACTDNIITWMHGKIYRVSYLRDKNIRFRTDLRTDEDAYFNAVACNSTQNIGMTGEVLYLWRANKKSLTRNQSRKNYFLETHMNYIKGQVEALKYLMEINESIPQLLITNTLINVYYYYMNARFYKCDEIEMDECIGTLKDEKWFQLWLNEGANWMDIITNIKAGQIYEGQYVVFFEEPFNKWATRIWKGEKE